MAKAPTSPKKKPSTAKPDPKPLQDPIEDSVEDAVVVEEIPADAAPEPVESVDLASEDMATPEDAPAQAAEPVDAEPVAEPEVATPALAKAGRNTGAFLGLLLGGVAAAAIGFGAARYVVPEGWPFPGTQSQEDPLPALVDAQGAEISALSDRLAALEANTTAEAALRALQGDVSNLENDVQAGLADLAARLNALDARLAAVEKMAPEGSAAAQTAADAYQRELANLREMFAGELAKVEAAQADAATLEAQVAETAQAAAGRAALAQVTSALDTGQPFEAALADLTSATGIEPPADLAAIAAEGAPTLATLQEAFPPAARAALDAAIRAAVDDGTMSRTAAFLRLQLGTRSLEPREGDDPDAILSRAEAALKQGNISAALADLEAMPEASAAALADWKALAQTRSAALKAGAALAQTLNAQ